MFIILRLFKKSFFFFEIFTKNKKPFSKMPKGLNFKAPPSGQLQNFYGEYSNRKY